ncbi:carbonic anhydrase [Stereum hirsutum FP-91666 SS1]|uniref:carbonic anhydrase n=1 Tax=Stereum hirsutum (strain FP-91666) TaxID=721885 RepID=UPI000444978E|nr:carbonic anhydrase [Stereum hirsutum FP-91666 SS1]EIM82464.1 carbonic anhydrase [Stereum hirsutum FP-91666 SS1]
MSSDLVGPEAVPRLLYSCNKAWANALVHNPYTKDIFTRSAEGQRPKLLWIGCSDSRAPETAVTNLAPGDLFVHRNIANQFLPLDLDVSAHAVLDYAVLHLHVQHVAIVGHTHCGGVEAAYNDAIEGRHGHSVFDGQDGKESFAFQEDSRGLLAPKSESTRDAPTPIETWLTSLTELARELDRDGQFGPDHAASIKVLREASVKRQVRNVVDTFPKGDPDHSEIDVWVHGWVYEVETGRLRDLEVTEQVTAYVKPKARRE